MKKFVFSLQKVLDLKAFAEEECKLALAKAIAVADGIKQELTFIADEKIKTQKERSKCISVEELLVNENYCTRLDLKKEELLEALKEAEQVIEEKRALFVEAMKERKVLDKLKEKKYSEYKKQANKQEADILDDVTQARYSANLVESES